MKTYQIHLLRHGITDGNINGQYIGSMDIPLNEIGENNIRALDESYVYPGAETYITSPMKRCRQTMEIIYPGVNPIEIDAFRECDFGEFEGLTAEQLRDNKDFAEWLASDGHSAPPSGESGVDFGARVCQAFEKIVDALMKTGISSAVIMTHGGVIMTILAHFGLPEASMSEWQMDPGCGYSVRIHPQLWTFTKKVEVYQTIPLPREEEDEDEEYYDEPDYLIVDVPEQGDEEAPAGE